MTFRKRIFKIAVVSIIVACAIKFIPWIVIIAWLTPLPDTVQDQVNKAPTYDLDGIIVYIDQKGRKPASYTAGWNDKANKITMQPGALFKIASISKLYIAAAATKIIISHELSPDDTLANLLPEFKGTITNANRITLRMLLQHRSGIPDWIKDPAFPWNNPSTDVDNILDLVSHDSAAFEPDSRYEYSNTNYLLIGKILDKTLRYNHRDYIKKEILAPLELTHTFSLMSEVSREEIVSGYDVHYDKDVKALDFVAPGSSMIATASDVGVFLRALNDGSLLNKEEQLLFSNLYKYEHTGLLPGYQSIARYHKSIDAVVIQFVNTTGGNSWTTAEVIYEKILTILKRNVK